MLTLTLFPTTTGLVLDLSTPTRTLANGAFITGVEGIRLQSTSGNDDIIASNDGRGALYNTIDGGSGNDTLRASAGGASLNGGFGTDELIGASGDDILVGGFGGENETLSGGGGNDTLIGSIGRDTLIGGAGADHFTLVEYYESGLTASNRDLITSFKRPGLGKLRPLIGQLLDALERRIIAALQPAVHRARQDRVAAEVKLTRTDLRQVLALPLSADVATQLTVRANRNTFIW